MDWKLVLGAIALIFGALAMAMEARADPVAVTFRNPANPGLPPSTEYLLCPHEGLACSLAIGPNCSPGETCVAAFDVDPGTYPNARLLARAASDGLDWSVPAVLTGASLIVPDADPPPVGALLRGDYTGDGCVSIADFSGFLGEIGTCAE